MNEPIKVKVGYQFRATLGDYENVTVSVELSNVHHTASDRDIQSAQLKAIELVSLGQDLIKDKVNAARKEAQEHGLERARYDRRLTDIRQGNDR